MKGIIYTSIILSVSMSLPLAGHINDYRGQGVSPKVGSIKIKDASASQAIRQIEVIYSARIGFEDVRTRTGTKPKAISLNVNGTLFEALNAFVKAADPLYSWEQVDGVINVFPKEVKHPFLETPVRGFEVNNATKYELLKAIVGLPELQHKAKDKELVNQRPHGVFAMRRPGEPDTDPRFSVSLRNVTARQILNQLLKDGVIDFWFFYTSGSNDENVRIVWGQPTD